MLHDVEDGVGHEDVTPGRGGDGFHYRSPGNVRLVLVPIRSCEAEVVGVEAYVVPEVPRGRGVHRLGLELPVRVLGEHVDERVDSKVADAEAEGESAPFNRADGPALVAVIVGVVPEVSPGAVGPKGTQHAREGDVRGIHRHLVREHQEPGECPQVLG